MRSMTDTLRAAALSWGSEPSLAVDVRDKRLRWSSTRWDDGSQCWIDQVADGDTIHRGLTDGSGNVKHAKVTDPSTSSQWTDWETLRSDAINNSDLAVARLDSDKIRIYYVKDAGSSTWDIVYVETSDGGENWSTPSNAATGINGAPAGEDAEPPRLAAAYQYLFYTEGGQVIARSIPWGGSPASPSTWTALGTLEERQGLGATYNGSTGLCYLVVAGAGTTESASTCGITIGTYTPSGPSWSSPLQIAPGGTGSASSDSALSSPSALYADGLYLVAWIDCFEGDSSEWTQPVVLSSDDWEHFGNEVALSIWASTYRRVALAYIASSKSVYAANERIACQTTMYSADDDSRNLTGLTPASYRRHTDEDGSRLHLEILNVDGAYDTIDQREEDAECIRPLSTVVLNRGYATSDGQERIALDPHYIVRASITQGLQQGRLVIDAVDGWGLLRMWRPNETLTWAKRTIRWLLTEICARVGLVFSGSAQTSFDYQVPTFTVHPSQDGAQMAHRLLFLAGAVAFFDMEGQMKAYQLYGYGPSYDDIGANDEILQGAYGPTVPSGTSFRVYGDEAGAAGETSWISMDLGLRLNVNRQDYRLTTDTAAQVVQQYDWTRARMSCRREGVTIPMRPDLELWDRVRLFPSGDVVPPSDCMRRVVTIGEEWDGEKGRYVSRVAMEDA